MIRVNIICEGATEENFVTRILYPYFFSKGIVVTPRKINTGSSFGKIKNHVIQWLKSESNTWITTLIDFYGISNKLPGFHDAQNLPIYQLIQHVEASFKEDIAQTGVNVRKFIPHFQLHEFEAMLFSDCNITEQFLALDYQLAIGVFQSIKNEFQSPEHINNSPLTAPSKRILKIAPSYEKVADGVLIAEAIGLDCIRRECSHFNDWIEKIEKEVSSSL